MKDIFRQKQEKRDNKESVTPFLPQDIAMCACVDEPCHFNLATGRGVGHREHFRVED